MIKDIVKDHFYLRQVSLPATPEDLFIVQDLKDTLKHYQDRCVGMAANMIGYKKRIIIFLEGDCPTVMINPEMIKHSRETYESEEGCLSHEGSRHTKRYQSIKVSYVDENFKKRIATYEGLTAQIVQHEMDHLEGILV